MEMLVNAGLVCGHVHPLSGNCSLRGLEWQLLLQGLRAGTPEGLKGAFPQLWGSWGSSKGQSKAGRQALECEKLMAEIPP